MIRFSLSVMMILFSITYSHVGIADGQSAGLVKGVFIDSQGQGLLKLTVPNAACGSVGTGGWDYSYDSTSSVFGQQWTSFLLAARMSSKLVKIGYKTSTGTGVPCELSYVYFYDS